MRSASQENDGGDHGHRAGRHRAGVPAQLAGLRVRELGVQRQSQTGDQANGLIGDIATIDADEEQIGLHEQLVVQPVEAERRAPPAERSEEHTSELQSLMRISYAVLSLKKKNNIKPLPNEYTQPQT